MAQTANSTCIKRAPQQYFAPAAETQPMQQAPPSAVEGNAVGAALRGTLTGVQMGDIESFDQLSAASEVFLEDGEVPNRATTGGFERVPTGEQRQARFVRSNSGSVQVNGGGLTPSEEAMVDVPAFLRDREKS